MEDLGLTAGEIAEITEYVDVLPGVAMDRHDLWRARLARAEGTRFRKIGHGMYQITLPHNRQPNDPQAGPHPSDLP